MRLRRGLTLGPLHLAQPDAAQSTALTLGMCPIVAYADDIDLAGKGMRLAPVAGMTALAWWLDEPLGRVGHVEDILLLAASSGPAWIALALVAFAALLFPFAASSIEPAPRSRALGTAYLFYFVGAFAATFCGAFPVPVFGGGAGPVLGVYAALAACVPRRPPIEITKR